MFLTRLVAARVTSDPCPGACRPRDVTELVLAAGQGRLPGWLARAGLWLLACM